MPGCTSERCPRAEATPPKVPRSGTGGAVVAKELSEAGLSVVVLEEGGHYTRVTVATSDVGESELDRVAKRFLAELHTQGEPGHVVRGAY